MRREIITTTKEAKPLDTQAIIAALEAERARLNQAIAALKRRPGSTASGKPDRRRRRLSAATRKRIGLAMEKRWAARKKAVGP
jgi:hypothetical protein